MYFVTVTFIWTMVTFEFYIRSARLALKVQIIKLQIRIYYNWFWFTIEILRLPLFIYLTNLKMFSEKTIQTFYYLYQQYLGNVVWALTQDSQRWLNIDRICQFKPKFSQFISVRKRVLTNLDHLKTRKWILFLLNIHMYKYVSVNINICINKYRLL